MISENPTTDELQRRICALEREVADYKARLAEQRTAVMKQQRYGLVWEDVPEAFDAEAENRLPILEEDTSLSVLQDDGRPTHLLIEGDNYHALTCLNYTHRGRVDVIYIDPPYNTGSDGFTYRDRRFLSEYPNGQKIDSNHPLRHSAWLSFMSKRLRLAKELLSQRGVIFISIDDNEQAALKLLCDKIFGEKNFAAIFPWRKRTAKADVPYKLSQDYEWVLCYAQKDFVAGIKKDSRKYYETPDFPNRPWRVHDLTQQRSAAERPKSYFTIVNPKTGEEYPANPNATWRITTDTYPDYLKAGRIVFPGDYSFLNISKPVLRYWKEDDERKAGEFFGFTSASTHLPTSVGMTQDGTKDIDALFGSKLFFFPKPVSLISYLLKIATPVSEKNNRRITVLDFFAGSGTTLHAVAQLNAEDGGQRQCILVQQQEDTKICETVTRERCRKVLTGYETKEGEHVDGLGGSLRYYRTAFVGKHRAQQAGDEDTVALALKAGCLLAIAENTLSEQKRTDFYQLFTDGDGRTTAIYFREGIEQWDAFLADVRQTTEHVVVYVFSWGDASEYEDDFTEFGSRVELKSIPKPILDIYKALA